MNKIIVQNNQTVWDVALQQYGSINYAFDLLVANPTISLENDLTAGQELIIPEVKVSKTEANVVDFYKLKSIKPSTGNFQLPPVANPIVTAGLVQWLRGGVGVVGNVWSDQSGNGNDATLVNGPIVNIDNIELDGVNDYIDLKSGNSLTQLSMSITVDYITLLNDTRLIGELSSSANYGMTTRAIYNGKMMYASGIGAWNTLNFTPVINTRYTFDFVADNGANTTLIYINGVLIITVPNGTVFSPIGIGNKYWGLYGHYLNGHIYDFKMYNRALTQVEITQNYNAL